MAEPITEAVTARGIAMPFWDAAAEVLAWPQPTARVCQPSRVLAGLRPLVRTRSEGISNNRATVTEAPLAAAQQVAAGVSPDAVFANAAEFADAVAYARCRSEAYAGLEDLLAMRAYLDHAIVPEDKPSLVVDHAATREQLSFITLLIEPHRLDGMRAAFDAFRSVFAATYQDHHRHYWKAFAKLTREVALLASTARAVDRLNRLEALGPPLAEEALIAFQRLESHLTLCPADDLAASLREQPSCSYCGLTMRDAVPAERLDDIAHGLNVALTEHERRLASQAVRRILARGGERLHQFIEIVQATDTASLASALDDDLLDFLQELLTQPVQSTASTPRNARQ